MDIMKLAQKAFALMREGREILANVQSAVTDGKAALNADQLDDLQEQLANEEMETSTAQSTLNDAIAEARGRL